LLFATILATILQLAVESYRWQMVPAYGLLAYLYFLYRRSRQQSAGTFAKGVGVFWFLLSMALPWTMPIVTLPEPTGPYAVGTHAFHWVDSTRLEWFTDEKDDYRELMVQIWYPVQKPAEGQPVPYIDQMNLRTDAMGEAGDFPGFLINYIDLFKTRSYQDAEAIKATTPLPVLILSHGITGMYQLHTVLSEDLASHGYVVVAPDHSYDANMVIFPDGRIADYRSDLTGNPDSVRLRRQQFITRVGDIRFVLTKIEEIQTGDLFPLLKGALNLDQIGILGHSYGGATAIQACKELPQPKACLALDGWLSPLPDSTIRTGIQQPFLFLGRPKWADSDYPHNYQLLERLLQTNHPHQYAFTVTGSRHLDFTDAPLLSPIASSIVETGTIDAQRAISIVNTATRTFFDQYLKDTSGNFLNDIRQYPEIVPFPSRKKINGDANNDL
jgi:predicted dienelactone hydrolase